MYSEKARHLSCPAEDWAAGHDLLRDPAEDITGISPGRLHVGRGVLGAGVGLVRVIHDGVPQLQRVARPPVG